MSSVLVAGSFGVGQWERRRMIAFDITVERTGGAALKKRDYNRIRSQAYSAAGTLWHQRFSRKHFTHAGARKYGYTKRKGQEFAFGSKAFRRSYTGRKWRKFRHTNPLQYTGESKRIVAGQTKVKATRRGAVKASVIMPARTFNRRPAGSMINMRIEMTTVATDETRQMGTKVEQVMVRGIKNFPKKRKRRFRG